MSMKRALIWLLLLLFYIRGLGSNRIIFYWIGSDVLSTQNNPFLRVFRLLTGCLKVKHICGAPWFVQELRDFGITAEPVLFPYNTELASSFADIMPPKTPFRMCSYISIGGWTSHEGERTLKIASLTPNVQWTIIGLREDQLPSSTTPPPNVRFAGWVTNPVEVQAECHAFFRLVKHDALSGVVRDALAMKRTVFYSMPVAGTINIGEMDDTEIAKLINLFISSSRDLGQNVYSNPLSLPTFGEQLRDLKMKIDRI